MARPAALTPKQVAEALNMSRRQVYRWIQKDEIETTKIDGTHRIFERQLAEKIGKQEAADVFTAHSTDDTGADE
jgi:excisionase family DNA binding protein